MPDLRYRLLDPGMRAYVERAARLPMDEDPEDVTVRRARYREHWLALRAPRPRGVRSADLCTDGVRGGLPIRVYRPPGGGAGTALYLHGGGWVVGDLDTHDDICAELAQRAGARVVAVAYRLAPEHRYPAAFDDCLSVYRYLRAAPDARRGPLVAVGDSAGANLAAALALAVRDRGLAPLAGQVLIYPGLGADQSLPAFAENAEAPLLSSADARWYLRAYLGAREADCYAAPLLARDLTGLAPAFVSVANHDPLRDDGVTWVQRLRAAGVPAELWVGEGLTHSFLRARHTSDEAGAAFAAVVDALRAMLAPRRGADR